MRPIFDTTYKGVGMSKYTCELNIANWSYSKINWIVFAMYQRMRSKGASWAGPRLKLMMYMLLYRRIAIYNMMESSTSILE